MPSRVANHLLTAKRQLQAAKSAAYQLRSKPDDPQATRAAIDATIAALEATIAAVEDAQQEKP